MISIVLRQQNNDGLFPLTLTRSVIDLRIGIFTIAEKWKRLLGRVPAFADGTTSSNTEEIDAACIPTKALADAIFNNENIEAALASCSMVRNPWDLFRLNDAAIRDDYKLLVTGKISEAIPRSVSVIGSDIFIEKEAKLSNCIINTETGPVYIAAGAEIMEGATIRGPFSLGEGAVVKMGARIYGATTIGPYCVAGGEIRNSIMMGYSNKAHDGYLGDSVIGEWCNFGAGTSVSNLKNNANTIRLWDNHQREFVDSGLQKCGLIMGDYSRAAINTSFNTGTIVGVCANVFGDGLMPKYIPGFSWGVEKASKYELTRALKDIDNWKKLKNARLTEPEKNRLTLIFDQI
jgi:UDP-N-acetylglucosamine diphosphorylase / glucose-1-phosphate thymidylyltransferase / UDP-N-acetylgalactosamine diphosphorylase / glucosamine-1-phosphate N-acetyltransferase / galactosamine-1-phosphate N-acetyltransferase